MNSCSKVRDNLTRIKPTEDWLSESRLKRCLTTSDLTILGVGCVLGAGLYVVTGELARDIAGPAVIISFFIAAVAAALSGICYAEFGCRIPKAGSAYMYSYATVGEFWAFVVGWNMILEYVIAAASLARACSEYINSFAQGYIFKFFMNDIATWNVSGLGSFPDFLAFTLALAASFIVSLGAQKSSLANKIVTIVNLAVILFIIVIGFYFADGENWKPKFAPYGFRGTLAAGASCFFAFVGFDVIGSAGEEAINPKHSLPFSTILTLVISFLAYFGVATVLTLMIPYHKLSHFAPLAEVFVQRGLSGAKYVVAIGGLCATMSSLLANSFAGPRIAYSMASDGLLFNWFAHVHEKTKVPVRAVLVEGSLAAILALLLDVKQLVELLSIGTIMSYTMVAIAVLVTRYTPGVQTVKYDDDRTKERTRKWLQSVCCRPSETEDKDGASHEVTYQRVESNDEESSNVTTEPDSTTSFHARVGAFLLTVSIMALNICLTQTQSYLSSGEIWAIILSCIFGLMIVSSLTLIIRQPRNSATFPFMVPGVPFIPALTIFVNTLLLVTLNHWTYIRFSIWMCLGLLVYFLYGYSHSLEAVRPSEKTESQFILTQTPDFGQEVEEYAPPHHP